MRPRILKAISAKLIFILLGTGAGLIVLLYFIFNSIQESQDLDDNARNSAPGSFIQLSDGITHYYELGSENSKPVLLIHGGGITGMEVWDNNAKFLADNGFRVLQYDLYGRGYSDRLETMYTPELLNRQLAELLEQTNFPDSLDVISMSLGSMVALDLLESSSKIKSIVLIDPVIAGDFKPSKALKIPVLSQLLMTFYWYPRSIENQRKEFVDQELFNQYSKRLEYFRSFSGYKHVNYSTWIHTLTQKRLELLKDKKPHTFQLIYGENDPYFSSKTATQLSEIDATISVHSIKNAGHLPHYEKPDEVNPLILNFLNREKNY